MHSGFPRDCKVLILLLATIASSRKSTQKDARLIGIIRNLAVEDGT